MTPDEMLELRDELLVVARKMSADDPHELVHEAILLVVRRAEANPESLKAAPRPAKWLRWKLLEANRAVVWGGGQGDGRRADRRGDLSPRWEEDGCWQGVDAGIAELPEVGPAEILRALFYEGGWTPAFHAALREALVGDVVVEPDESRRGNTPNRILALLGESAHTLQELYAALPEVGTNTIRAAARELVKRGEAGSKRLSIADRVVAVYFRTEAVHDE